MYYHADDFAERINWLGGDGMFSFPIFVPMWYLRDLMVLCILSPVIWWLMNESRKILRQVALALIAMTYITAVYPYVPGLSPGPVLYFSFGALLALGGMSLTSTLKMLRLPTAVLFLLLWIPLIPLAGYRTELGNWLYPWFIMAGVVSIINLFAMLESKGVKWLEFCRRHEADVFFIFAAHNLVLSDIHNVLMKICAIITGEPSAKTVTFADAHLALLIVCYLLKIAVVIWLCVIASRFINTYLPKSRQLLTGRGIRDARPQANAIA